MQRKKATLAERREQAAFALAKGGTTDEQIAHDAGVHVSTLWRWEQDPDFAARVAEHKAELAAGVVAKGIAERQNRVDALNDRWRKIQAVIAARGKDLAEETPGGETGLLVRQQKMLGLGKYAREVTEYVLDAGLLAQLLAHEKQAAIELGQWSEKRDVTSGGKSIDSWAALVLAARQGGADEAPSGGG